MPEPDPSSSSSSHSSVSSSSHSSHSSSSHSSHSSSSHSSHSSSSHSSHSSSSHSSHSSSSHSSHSSSSHSSHSSSSHSSVSSSSHSSHSSESNSSLSSRSSFSSHSSSSNSSVSSSSHSSSSHSSSSHSSSSHSSVSSSSRSSSSHSSSSHSSSSHSSVSSSSHSSHSSSSHSSVSSSSHSSHSSSSHSSVSSSSHSSGSSSSHSSESSGSSGSSGSSWSSESSWSSSLSSTSSSSASSASSESSQSSGFHFIENPAYVDWNLGIYDDAANLASTLSPIDWSLTEPAGASIDEAGIITFGQSPALLSVKAVYNPEEGGSVTQQLTASGKVAPTNVRVVQASIRSGEFAVTIDPLPTDPATVQFYFKNGSVVAALGKPEIPTGTTVTLNLDDLVGSLKSSNGSEFTEVFAELKVGKSKPIKSPPVALDVPKVRVLANRIISNYMTPDIDAVWVGAPLTKGAYVAPFKDKQLYNMDLPVDFLNAIDPINASLGVKLNAATGHYDVMRPEKQTPVDGYPPIILLKTKNETAYVEFPVLKEDNFSAGCKNPSRDLTATSCAVRDKDALDLKCDDEVFVPTYGVRTVDDHGSLHGNTNQIDIWMGRGGSALWQQVLKVLKKNVVCLKIIK